MAKHKSPQDLMAARNPLVRKPVEPIDIYTSPVQIEAEESERTPESIVSKATREQVIPTEPASPAAAPKKNMAKAYTTYLHSSQIKGIKLRAIDQDVNDFAIVQKAIDEYFQRHPL